MKQSTATVIVIDDDTMVLEIVGEFLEKTGYRVLCAKGGEEGMGMFDAEQSIHDRDGSLLVLTDIEMPAFNGYQVANYVRSSTQGTVPVIGMTGSTVDEGSDSFDRVLFKPMELEELSGVVETYI